MPNPKLAYRHQMLCPLQIPLSIHSSGMAISSTILWSVDNPTLASISPDGILTRQLNIDSGTVTVTCNGFYLDPTVETVNKSKDEGMVPFIGVISFDLVPIADLIPPKDIVLKFSTV